MSRQRAEHRSPGATSGPDRSGYRAGGEEQRGEEGSERGGEPIEPVSGSTLSGVGVLDDLFATTRAEGRAALVGYLPAGFPDVPRSKDLLRAMIDGGCDMVEVGMPFSDPVLDGPVIQSAQLQALTGGTRIRDVLGTVEAVAAAGGRAVVMTYFNPVLAYGVDRFARDLASAGGSGVITPDLIVDEADAWTAATSAAGIAPIFLVAPSSPRDRILPTAAAARGFLYAAAVMGVTGGRDQVGSEAPALVARCREVTDLPIGVGLGVRNAAQAAEIAAYADAVIVGSAFVALGRNGAGEALGGTDGPDDAAAATRAVARLAAELAAGVRSPHRPAEENRL